MKRDRNGKIRRSVQCMKCGWYGLRTRLGRPCPKCHQRIALDNYDVKRTEVAVLRGYATSSSTKTNTESSGG